MSSAATRARPLGASGLAVVVGSTRWRAHRGSAAGHEWPGYRRWGTSGRSHWGHAQEQARLPGREWLSRRSERVEKKAWARELVREEVRDALLARAPW